VNNDFTSQFDNVFFGTKIILEVLHVEFSDIKWPEAIGSGDIASSGPLYHLNVAK
jgi:hypothetical protein